MKRALISCVGMGRRGSLKRGDTCVSIALFRLTRSSNYPALGQRPVLVVHPNLGAFSFPCQPFGVADGKLPLTVSRAARCAPGGLEQPIATEPGVRDDFENDCLGLRLG